MSIIELRSKIHPDELFRCYKRQSFAFENPIPQFEDVYDDVLETMLVFNRNQGVPHRVLVLNALMDYGVSFILEERVVNIPMRVVW